MPRALDQGSAVGKGVDKTPPGRPLGRSWRWGRRWSKGAKLQESHREVGGAGGEGPALPGPTPSSHGVREDQEEGEAAAGTPAAQEAAWCPARDGRRVHPESGRCHRGRRMEGEQMKVVKGNVSRNPRPRAPGHLFTELPAQHTRPNAGVTLCTCLS